MKVASPQNPRYRGLHPVAVAVLRKTIREDVARLECEANVHSLTGNHAANLVDRAGRLVYIVCKAATDCQVCTDHPDIRILRGMGEAIGDLSEDLAAIEKHRPAILSGCAAVARLLPLCNDWALGLAVVDLEQRLAATRGMKTADLKTALGVA